MTAWIVIAVVGFSVSFTAKKWLKENLYPDSRGWYKFVAITTFVIAMFAIWHIIAKDFLKIPWEWLNY